MTTIFHGILDVRPGCTLEPLIARKWNVFEKKTMSSHADEHGEQLFRTEIILECIVRIGDSVRTTFFDRPQNV